MITEFIRRITLLDPALPLFTKDASDSTRKSDAMFIDTIHTSGGSLGEVNPRLVTFNEELKVVNLFVC